MRTLSSKTRGIFYVIFAAFGFSGMSLFVKLAGDLPAMEKAFFRNFVALVFIGAIMLFRKISFFPKKQSIPFLFGRSFCGTVGLLCNFYAIGYLNLSDANMLNKLSPFFAILFSALLLGEKPKLLQVLFVAVAFLGSLFIMKPGFASAPLLPAAMGVIGGMGAGAAYTFVRKLGSIGEESHRIVFWFSAFSCFCCLPFLLFSDTRISGLQWAFLLLAGLFACFGQIGITRAYLCAPAREISVYDYTQVLFAALLGFLVFGDLPDGYSLLGYGLICLAGVAMFWYNNRMPQAEIGDRSDKNAR